MTDILSASYAIIPIAGAIALAAFTVAILVRTRLVGRRLTTGAVLWPIPFIVLLAGMGTLCANGMCAFAPGALCAFTAATELCGGATLVRTYLVPWFDRIGSRSAHLLRAARDLVLLFIAALISAWALEAAWNESMGQIPLAFFALSVGIVFVAMLALYFIGQRCGALPAVVVLACVGFGIGQHFILEFKSAAILPSDLLALETAAAVSGGYTYLVTDGIVTAVIGGEVAVALLSFIWPGRARSFAVGLANVAANLCAGLALIGVLAGAYSSVKLEQALGFAYDRWMPITTYQAYGFLPSFIAVAQDLPIPEPEDYTDGEAESLEAQFAAAFDAQGGASAERAQAVEQFAQVQPTVIAIMNETFTDLSLFQGLRDAGYTGPAFYNSLADTLQRGTLMASVNGGGTANTEFEFLTGNSVAFIGNGKYPYQLYNLSDVDSLAKQLSALGYSTTAIHAQAPNNWNRTLAYRQLGFDEFISLEDFADAPQYHAGATDRSTYDKILELLAADDGPQFIFDVTIQNHSGYDAGSVPAEEFTSYAPAGITDETLLTQLNTYLTCINASDRDLQYLIERLSQLDRPVVLVFFGDHQPFFTSSLNDAMYPDEDALTHQWRLFESTYFIWANYDVAGNDQVSAWGEIGANELGAQALNMIGAPLSDYQKALLATRGDIVSISANGYRGGDGACYAIDDESSPYKSLVDELRDIQYLNFARRVE